MNKYTKKARSRKSQIKHHYGLSWDAYMSLLESQEYLCAICACQPSDDARFCVDHDHSTGKVRGVLCNSCNVALGHFKDSIGNLERAAKYMEKSRGQ